MDKLKPYPATEMCFFPLFYTADGNFFISDLKYFCSSSNVLKIAFLKKN